MTTYENDVTVTTTRCPREAEHKTDKNVLLRQRQDGSRFCPLHGDVAVNTRTRKQVKAEAEAVAPEGTKVQGIHVGTWLGRPGDSYCLLLGSKSLGHRVTVHRWDDSNEVTVRRVYGDAWRDPENFREAKSTIVVVNPTNEQLSAAVALMAREEATEQLERVR